MGPDGQLRAALPPRPAAEEMAAAVAQAARLTALAARRMAAPGLIIAAPASGSGKTVVTLGLLRHLGTHRHRRRLGQGRPRLHRPRLPRRRPRPALRQPRSVGDACDACSALRRRGLAAVGGPRRLRGRHGPVRRRHGAGGIDRRPRRGARLAGDPGGRRPCPGRLGGGHRPRLRHPSRRRRRRRASSSIASAATATPRSSPRPARSAVPEVAGPRLPAARDRPGAAGAPPGSGPGAASIPSSRRSSMRRRR